MKLKISIFFTVTFLFFLLNVQRIFACKATFPPQMEEGTTFTVDVSETKKNHEYWVGLEKPAGVWVYRSDYKKANYDNETLSFNLTAPIAGEYLLSARSITISEPSCINRANLKITPKGTPLEGKFRCTMDGRCVTCAPTESGCIFPDSSCNQACGPGAAGKGIQPTLCKQGEPGEGIQTALGCIPTKDPTQFVGWLLKFAIGIGGGIAFLLIIFGAIKILTSAGNPENVKAGQEMITSALMGLLFIIFSLFLLQLIGVKILNIPGFGR